MQSSSRKTRGGMRLISALMAMVLAIGLMPLPAFAGETPQADLGLTLSAQETEGVVYISISDDGKYVESDGSISGKTMANLAIPISEVEKIDLESYGLGEYAYQVDGADAVTLLHLYLYVLSNYYSGGTDSLVISGGAGSMYLESGFWGFDQNLVYDVDFGYPLEDDSWGATADRVVLHQGLHVDVTHFTDWSFYNDDNAGHCYFYDASKNLGGDAITLEYSATANAPVSLGVLRGKVDSNYNTVYCAVANQDVYYGTSYTTDNPTVLGTTDGNGVLSATFSEPGTYYVWTNGLTGSSDTVVSGPAMATVTVKAAEDEDAVPAALQLSQLEFRSGSTATSTLRVLEPAFDPAVKNYTLIAPTNVSTVGYAFATLSDTATGTIQATYPKNGTGAAQAKTITSGGKVSLQNSLASNSLVGNTITITVGGEEAYVVNVVRQPALNALTVVNGSETVTLTPSFAGTTFEYSAILPAEAELAVTPTISNTALGNAVDFDVAGQDVENKGSAQVAPVWANHAYDLAITLSGEGARNAVYTIHCAEQVSTLAVETPPDKTTYDPGESFDPTGMTLKATYANGDEQIIGSDAFTYEPSGALKLADSTITVSYGGATATQTIAVNNPFEGTGTQDDPFLIKTAADYDTVYTVVSGGDTLEGAYLKQMADITLSDGWKSIGSSATNCFSGNLDGGNYTVTVPADCPPLLGFVKFASVSNLNIYGTRINGAGLVNNMQITGISGSALTLDGITLKSGSNTVASGLVDVVPPVNPYGAVSAGFMTTIKNSTVESGVTVGCDGDRDYVGGFAGRFQGTIENSTCYATVKGTSYVGGFIGMRANSMGYPVGVSNSTFGGAVVATGEYVGGIAGAGYIHTTAPNAGSLDLIGNTVTGAVTGANKVGGILGGDAIAQQWSNLPFEFKDNVFLGTVAATSAEADAVGGIAGYYRSLNKYAVISNNSYSSSCGAAKGIGKVDYVDTNSTTHETESGATYFNTETSTSDCPSVSGCAWKKAHNRTDDPLGVDAANLCKTTSAPEWVADEITLPTFESEGSISYSCTVDGNELTKTEVIPAYGLTVEVDGKAVPATAVKIEAGGYDASYTDWQTGGKVESIIPLVTVTVPTGTESVGISLSDSFAQYQCYVYDVAQGENGYIDMGFGEETTVGGMETVIAEASKAYEAAVLPAGQVYRVQSAYDANWNSYNLYAIAFETADPAEEFVYEGDAVNFIKSDGKQFGMFTPQDGTAVTYSADGNLTVTYYPKNTTVYAGFYLDADIRFGGTWGTDKYYAAAEDGSYTFTLPIAYAGYAWPVVPVKKSDATATTSAQYYLAIPAKPNIAPTLADGVEATAAASVWAMEAYELDLSAIFTDEDNDALTYKVKVGDADAVDAEAAYSFASEEAGTYTLEFTANDGKADSASSYTVTLTVVEPTTAKVDFTSQMSGGFLHAPQYGYGVASNQAEKYGFSDDVDDGVSALDVLVAAHELVFDERFTTETAGEYLAMSNGSPTKQFGVDGSTYYGGFYVNHAYPNDGSQGDSGYNGTVVGTHAVSDGDLVEFFFYEDAYYGDTYNWFVGADGYSRTFAVHVDEELELTLEGFFAMYGSEYKDAAAMVAGDAVFPVEDAQIYVVDGKTGELEAIEGAVTGEDGKAKISFAEPGTYMIAAYGTEDCTFTQIVSLTTVEVSDHQWSEVFTPPTFDVAGSLVKTCSLCGKVEETAIPAYGLTVTVDGTEVAADAVEIEADGYDASYENWYQDESGQWFSGGKVESIIPLVTVTVPYGTESVGISLSDSFAKYQNYIYTAEPGGSGYTEYIDYGFGDKVDDYTYIADTGKAYDTAVLSADKVYRVQSAYDANYVSYNLYAIAFETMPVIVTEELPEGYIDTDYEVQIEAIGEQTPTLSVSGLPAGLSFDEATGKIVGVPTESGDFTVAVEAAVGSKSTSAEFILAIGIVDETAFNEAKEAAEKAQNKVAILAALAAAQNAADAIKMAADSTSASTDPADSAETAQAAVDTAQAAVERMEAVATAADEAVQAAQVAADLAVTNTQKAEAAELVAAAEAIQTQVAEAKASADAAKTAADDAKARADAALAEKTAADAAAAKAVTDAIAALPAASKATALDKAAADKAKAAYDKLTADQKALVPAASVTKLNKVKAAADNEAANGLAKGKKFTVTNKKGTFVYKVTAKKQVTLVKAKKTKKNGIIAVNNVKYHGVAYKVTAVGAKAFKASKFKKVVLGANVKTVGKLAFAKSSVLKTFTVGKNVTKISAKAFKNAKKLKKITVKSAKLKKKSTVKNSLKGSKVKTVKLSGMSKAAKKKVIKAFVAAGKKNVTVK